MCRVSGTKNNRVKHFVNVGSRFKNAAEHQLNLRLNPRIVNLALEPVLYQIKGISSSPA